MQGFLRTVVYFCIEKYTQHKNNTSGPLIMDHYGVPLSGSLVMVSEYIIKIKNQL